MLVSALFLTFIDTHTCIFKHIYNFFCIFCYPRIIAIMHIFTILFFLKKCWQIFFQEVTMKTAHLNFDQSFLRRMINSKCCRNNTSIPATQKTANLHVQTFFSCFFYSLFLCKFFFSYSFIFLFFEKKSSIVV